jgi:hypothetical protein
MLAVFKYSYEAILEPQLVADDSVEQQSQRDRIKTITTDHDDQNSNLWQI